MALPGKLAMAGCPGGFGGRAGGRAGTAVARLSAFPFAGTDFLDAFAGAAGGRSDGFAGADFLDGLTCATGGRSEGLICGLSDVRSAGFPTGPGAGSLVACPPVNRTEGLASALAGGAWRAAPGRGGGAWRAAGGGGGGAALWGCGKPPERAG